MTNGQKVAKGFGLVLACVIVLVIVGIITTSIFTLTDRHNITMNEKDVDMAGAGVQNSKYGDMFDKNYKMTEKDYNMTFDKLSRINCDTGHVKLVITEGETNSIVTQKLPDNYSVSYNGGTLVVESESEFDFFDMLFRNELFSSEERVIFITVAKDTELESIILDTGSGNSFIDSVKTKRLEVDGGSGELEFTGTKAEDVDLDLGSGASLFDGVAFGNINCIGGSGSVSFERSSLVSGNLDMGSGRLSYTGNVEGPVEIDGGSGNITFEIDEDASLFSLQCSAGSGGIYVNGNKVDSLSTIGTVDHKKIDIDGGSGSVSLNFR